MRVGIGWIGAVLAFGFVGGGAQAEGGFPKPKRDFSADVSMKLDGGATGSMESKGRAYFGGGHQRREVSAMGRTTVVILRADGTRWTLLPDQKMYIESKDGAPGRESGPDPMRSHDAKLEKIGSETLNGLETDKYEVTASGSTGTAWLTSDHVPVRYQGKANDGRQTMNIHMDYTNHQFGAQSPTLFELPEGYSPVPAFGGALGMPPGGVPGGAAMPSEAEMKRSMEQLRKQMEHLKRQRAPSP
jgi:hypothetical protein